MAPLGGWRSFSLYLSLPPPSLFSNRLTAGHGTLNPMTEVRILLGELERPRTEALFLSAPCPCGRLYCSFSATGRASPSHGEGSWFESMREHVGCFGHCSAVSGCESPASTRPLRRGESGPAYISIRRWCRHAHGGFCLGGPTVRTSACQTEDTGSIPVQGSMGRWCMLRLRLSDGGGCTPWDGH